MVLVDNHWKISEDESVDTVIARVQASDNDPNDVLTFGLEADNEDVVLPFRINRDTGVVYLNESLEGRGGENFLLYVTVTDGTYNAKNGIYVNIKAKNSQTNENPIGNGSPKFIQRSHNVTHLFPPFHTLPGVPPRPPYWNGTFASPPILPNIYNNPPPNYHQTKTYPDPVVSPTHPGANNSNDQPHKSNDTPTKTKTKTNPNGTIEIPFNGDNENASNETNTVAGNGVGTANGTNSTSETTIFPRTTLKTVLPVAIIVCGIIIASGLIVSSFLFRKRLCAIGKSLKNKSKEEMAKKSNQSNLSSSNMTSPISEDSRNSMVMQHWNGPTAFNNRYVPWERENSHMQVNTQHTQYKLVENCFYSLAERVYVLYICMRWRWSKHR